MLALCSQHKRLHLPKRQFQRISSHLVQNGCWFGRDPALVHGTIHYGNPKGDQSDSYFLPTLEKFDQDFHVFALEWEPGEFRWYVDGELYHQTSQWYTSDPGAPEGAPFDQSFYWILNVAVGWDWPGYPDESSEFPQRMLVDYVRVYQKE